MSKPPANVIQFEPSKSVRGRIKTVSKLDGMTEQELITAAVIAYCDGEDARDKYFNSVLDGPLCTREYHEVMVPEKYVVATLKVPAEAAKLFPGPKYARLGSASVASEADIEHRAGQWNKPHPVGHSGIAPATSTHVATMKEQPCNTPVQFRFPADDWSLIERLAVRLKITVGDYLLGCVGYTVWLSQQQSEPSPAEDLAQFSPLMGEKPGS